MKFLNTVLALVLVCGLMLGSAGTAVAQDDSLEVEGVVDDITIYDGVNPPFEEAIGEVVIDPDDGAPVELIVTEDTDIERDGEEADIEDLEEGDWARARYYYDSEEDCFIAEEIEATSEKPLVGKRRGLFGEVVQVEELSEPVDGATHRIELKTRNLGTVDVYVTDETLYHIPTLVPPWQEGLLKEVEPGDRIAVLALEDEDGNFFARRIMIVPGKPVRNRHIVGVVIETGPVHITIVDKEGNETTIDIPEGVTIELSQGELATLIANFGKGGWSKANPRAKTAHTMDKLFQRLENRIEEMEEEHGGQNVQKVERLKALKEKNNQSQLKYLERARERLSEQNHEHERAREAIEQAMERAKERAREHGRGGR